MKVEIEKIQLGVSPITEKIFAGVSNKAGTMWLHKIDVTNSFISCVISKWENQKEVIQAGEDKWEITVKKLK